jgi:hypothetical protein
MTIVLQIPERLKGLIQSIQSAIQTSSQLVDQFSQGDRIDYASIETLIAQQAAGIERATHQALLEALDIDAPLIKVGDVVHTRVGRYPGTYYCQAGPVQVERSLYRPVDSRNAKTVDPVSERVGVVGAGWLPATARAMAHALQQGTSREAEALATEWNRLPYSRSSFEDVGHTVGQLLTANRSQIEEQLIQEYKIPPEAYSISVGLDRVTIPMEEELPRPVGRPKADAPRRPVARNYRMAYCGTVTLNDKDGRALHTIRYGRMPQGDEEALVVGLADDVIRLRQQRPDLKVQLLCDGAPEMWNLLDEHINNQTIGQSVHRLIDFYHLAEKLGEAAKLLVTDDKQREQLLGRWKLQLLNRQQASEEILMELKGFGLGGARVGKGYPVKEAVTYLENHRAQLDYATARSMGLAIASGPLEATCKSLVNQRFKRSGSRWKERTGEHILHLRALALSDRWDSAMQLLLNPLGKKVTKIDSIEALAA